MIIQLKYHTQPHKDRKIPYEWSSFNDRKSTMWKFDWRIPKSGCFNTQSVIILDDLGVPSGKLTVCFKKKNENGPLGSLIYLLKWWFPRGIHHINAY